MAILLEVPGQVEYKYPTAEVFQVTLALAGKCTKRARIATYYRRYPMIYYGMRWLLMGRF